MSDMTHESEKQRPYWLFWFASGCLLMMMAMVVRVVAGNEVLVATLLTVATVLMVISYQERPARRSEAAAE